MLNTRTSLQCEFDKAISAKDTIYKVDHQFHFTLLSGMYFHTHPSSFKFSFSSSMQLKNPLEALMNTVPERPLSALLGAALAIPSIRRRSISASSLANSDRIPGDSTLQTDM